MGMEDKIHYPNISKYELDKNEPPLVRACRSPTSRDYKRKMIKLPTLKKF